MTSQEQLTLELQVVAYLRHLRRVHQVSTPRSHGAYVALTEAIYGVMAGNHRPEEREEPLCVLPCDEVIS